MNVYDFDNTIYDGETVVDFYLFCVKKNPSLLRFLPFTLNMLIRYKLGRVSLEELEKKAVKYVGKVLLDIKDLSGTVKEFWDKNQHKIKKFYLLQQRPDDVIISASCGFILAEICSRLKIKNCLCSEIDTQSGKILRICYRANKPEIFKKYFPNSSIDKFYTDSMNDLPMIKLACQSFIVRGEKIKEIRKEDV